MSNLIDAEAGTERFGGYEAELKLVQADLSQQIEQIKESTGEPRKAAISRAERALEEADELGKKAPAITNLLKKLLADGFVRDIGGGKWVVSASAPH